MWRVVAVEKSGNFILLFFLYLFVIRLAQTHGTYHKGLVKENKDTKMLRHNRSPDRCYVTHTDNQVRNRLGRPGVAKSFLRGAHNF